MLMRLLSIGAITVALTTVEASAQGRWIQVKSMPQGANEVIGAAVDGLLYVYGGERMHSQHVYGGVNLKGQPLGMFWSYDPRTDVWTRLSTNAVPVHHAAAAAVGRKFYVFGGFRLPDTGKIGWYPENKTWAYDIDTQSWAQLPPMPTARGALAGVAVDKKIYVIGGAKIPSGVALPDGLTAGGPIEILGTMEMFDTETNTWTSMKPMTLPRNHHDVAYLDGKLYVVGGTTGSCFPGGWSSNVPMNEVYDIATGTWSTGAPMPTARSGIGAAALDGKIYVIGGEGWDKYGGVFRANEAYDPQTNSWEEAPAMPTPRHGFAKGVVDGKLYAVSGVAVEGGPFSVVAVTEVYAP
jgi:N-acetylneuraminic acid mutarotase